MDLPEGRDRAAVSPDHPLRGVGVSEGAELTYLHLVRGGPTSPDELSRELPEGVDATVALEELSRLGLVSVTVDEVRPLAPRGPLDDMARQREIEASLARESAAMLGDLWMQHAYGPSYLELVSTTSATEAAKHRLIATAQEQVLALAIGRIGDQTSRQQLAPGTIDALRRGVDFRVVYGAEILTRSDVLQVVRESIAAGERARVFPDVPFNLQISEQFALIMIAGRGSERLNAVIVHHSGLYDGLVGVFETYWRVGVPVPVAADESVPTMTPVEHRQLLTLLSAGLTDESIARELGVSQRTVARRIAQFQQALGARSRFQLGVQAARQGWL